MKTLLFLEEILIYMQTVVLTNLHPQAILHEYSLLRFCSVDCKTALMKSSISIKAFL